MHLLVHTPARQASDAPLRLIFETITFGFYALYVPDGVAALRSAWNSDVERFIRMNELASALGNIRGERLPKFEVVCEQVETALLASGGNARGP